VTDAACIVWESSCGKNGNCWLYDLEKFRYLLHGTAVAFMCVGTLFDIGIWFYADRLKGLYDEEEDEEDDKEDDSRAVPADKPPPFPINEPPIYANNSLHELISYNPPKESPTTKA
jgi:hypothetical protein